MYIYGIVNPSAWRPENIIALMQATHHGQSLVQQPVPQPMWPMMMQQQMQMMMQQMPMMMPQQMPMMMPQQMPMMMPQQMPMMMPQQMHMMMPAMMHQPMGQPAAAGAKAPAKVPKGSPPKPGKAQQWQALVDQTSGNTYYYNDATDESSWNKPAGF